MYEYSVWSNVTNQHDGSTENLKHNSTTKSMVFVHDNELILPWMVSMSWEIPFTITECSRCDLQILQTAFINCARILIMSVSVCSFGLIVRHIFSVTLKSGNWDGQVIMGISFLTFHSHVILELYGGALSSWNIKGFFAKCFATAGHKFASKVCVYIWQSILLSTGTKSSYAIMRYAAQNLANICEQPPALPRHSSNQISSGFLLWSNTTCISSENITDFRFPKAC